MASYKLPDGVPFQLKVGPKTKILPSNERLNVLPEFVVTINDILDSYHHDDKVNLYAIVHSINECKHVSTTTDFFRTMVLYDDLNTDVFLNEFLIFLIFLCLN